MSERYSIVKLIDEIDEHPLRWEVITLESAMSLPTLRLNDGKIVVEFYFYPSGGSIDNRQIWPPYYRAISQVDSAYRVDFSSIDPQELWTISTEQPLGSGALPTRSHSVGSAESRDEYEAKLQSLYTQFDQLIDFYPKPASEISTTEKQVVTEFYLLFYSLSQVSLIPAYKTLNPSFFDWLGAITEQLDYFVEV
ncbi:hypothetical protein [Chamaesiphon sp. OTE_75_metabat_556]|uniref:hypothetical protein n=1 Tax=Chamaesiphon sp. OTE_75_metabat_556 TaxID=2964692 RepID=UPI00286D49ED|nr:hypothetical protein [Chamaesiphon sp. OTE_75_metabat_556]